MSPSVFPVVEYEELIEFDHDEKDVLLQPLRWRRGRILAVDLRFVSSARGEDYHGSTVIITIGGGNGPIRIGAKYPDFLRDWMSARA